MPNRFAKRNIGINDREEYKEYLKERGVKQINYYLSPIFVYPTDEDLKNIRFDSYTWSYGDKLAKLADKYYGNPKDWWIIARFNKIGAETELKIGDIIKIPLDLNSLNYLIRG